MIPRPAVVSAALSLSADALFIGTPFNIILDVDDGWEELGCTEAMVLKIVTNFAAVVVDPTNVTGFQLSASVCCKCGKPVVALVGPNRTLTHTRAFGRTRFAFVAKPQCTSTRMHFGAPIALEVTLPWSGLVVRSQVFTIRSRRKPLTNPGSNKLLRLPALDSSEPLRVSGLISAPDAEAVAEASTTAITAGVSHITLPGFIRVVASPYARVQVVERIEMFGNMLSTRPGFVSFTWWFHEDDAGDSGTSNNGVGTGRQELVIKFVSFTQFETTDMAIASNELAMAQHRPTTNIVLSTCHLW